MKNRNWIIGIIVGVIALVIIATVIIIAINSLNNGGKRLSNKIEDELKYLDKTTLSMINQLNNLRTNEEIEVQRTAVAKTTQNISGGSNQESSGGSSNKMGQEGGESSGSEGGSESSGSSGGGDSKSENIEKYFIENNSVLLRDTNSIDWNDLEVKAENLYDSWTTITLDLNAMNVTNDNILAYNKNLDNLLLSIRDKNRVNSAICLANLYSLIPKYMSETLDNEDNLKIENIKSNIVSAYSLVEVEKWKDIIDLLGSAETDLTAFINSSKNLSNTKRAKANKAYVLLKELIKTSNEKNKDMFYFKYINLIEELNNL